MKIIATWLHKVTISGGCSRQVLIFSVYVVNK